jgi:hypothetical protein
MSMWHPSTQMCVCVTNTSAWNSTVVIVCPTLALQASSLTLGGGSCSSGKDLFIATLQGHDVSNMRAQCHSMCLGESMPTTYPALLSGPSPCFVVHTVAFQFPC